jgi:hypothetical protein
VQRKRGTMKRNQFWALTGLFCIVAAAVQPASAFEMTKQTSKNKKHFSLNIFKGSKYPHMQHQSDKPRRRVI